MRFNCPFNTDITEFQTSLTSWACPRISTEVVEPYNTVLYVRSRLEYTDVLVMMDNEALYHISSRCYQSLHMGLASDLYSSGGTIQHCVVRALWWSTHMCLS